MLGLDDRILVGFQDRKIGKDDRMIGDNGMIG